MKHSLQAAPLYAIILFLTLSCSTNGMQDEYHDWLERNEAFISDISVRTDPSLKPDDAKEGDMFRILQYDIDPSKEYETSRYVYCQVIKSGEGDGHPIYTDRVSIHYRGRLMPTEEHPEGFIFDQSYNTEAVNPSLSVPKEFVLSELVKGMASALQYMSTGDTWRLIMPYQLGYGSSKKNEIPA